MNRTLSPRRKLLITLAALGALALVLATAWVLFDRWREKRAREPAILEGIIDAPAWDWHHGPMEDVIYVGQIDFTIHAIGPVSSRP